MYDLFKSIIKMYKELMKMKKTKAIVSLILSLGFIACNVVPVSAEDKISIKTVEKIGAEERSSTKGNTSKSSNEYTAENGYLEIDENGKVVGNPADGYMQKVSVEEVEDKIVTKTSEIVNVVQEFGKPASILMFILAAIYTLFGCIAKKGVLTKGLLAMGITIVCYVTITYAYDIVYFVSGWLVN